MDIGSIATAFIASQAAQLQMAAAAKLLQMNAQMGDDAVKLLEAAQQNADRLANVASGIGANLDISV